MKKLLLLLAILTLTYGTAHAVIWEVVCSKCHNGIKAPSKTQLKKSYKSKEQLINAAKKVSVPDMESIKKDTNLLKSAAEEIFR